MCALREKAVPTTTAENGLQDKRDDINQLCVDAQEILAMCHGQPSLNAVADNFYNQALMQKQDPYLAVNQLFLLRNRINSAMADLIQAYEQGLMLETFLDEEVTSCRQ